ncbi:MAG: hypothetical protein H6Q90_978 [Deltaproteobacteria bacterium]|nr:hypothetical protein [Deltaproteobacteria bacterium]
MRSPWILGALAALLPACGGRQVPERPHRSQAEHLAAASEHDRRAAREDLARDRAAAERASWDDPAAYSCGDVVLNDQLTTGGQRLTSWMPCWDFSEEAQLRHRWRAQVERQAAAEERARATALARTERAACRGIPDRELTHSVFAHTQEIAEVIPHRDTGRIHGVRIVFKPVLGLTAGWVEQAIRCQQARFATLGRPATPNDPSLIEGAEVTVTEREGHVEVLVTSPSDVDAQIALDRAQELMREQTATR